MQEDESQRLIWIDLEMTGLDTGRDSILEVATLVTDNELNELAEGPVYAISHTREILEAMDSWNTRHHGESGLRQQHLPGPAFSASADAGAGVMVSLPQP